MVSMASRSRIYFAVALALVVVSFEVANATDAPIPLWSRAFTATPIDPFPSVLTVNVVQPDPAGGVVIAGWFHGSADFGGGPIISRPWVNEFGENSNIFAARYDSLGQHTWSRVLASADGYVNPLSMAVDAERNIVVVGQFRGTLDLGGLTLTSSFIDAFAAKYDINGVLLWGKRFGISGPGENAANDVAIDANGDIVMIGTMAGSVDFGGGIIYSFLNSSDVFLVKLDPAGGHVWSRTFGGLDVQQGRHVVIDGQGHLKVCGHFSRSIDLGGGALTAISSQEMFLADFDPQGNHAWSRSVRGSNAPFYTSFDGSDAGFVAFGTLFGDSIVLDGETLHGRGYVAAVLDPTGTYRWKFYPGVHPILGVSLDENEGLVVSGQFYGSLDIGGQTLTSMGNVDGYLAGFDANGEFEWATQIGGNGSGDTAKHTLGVGNDIWVWGEFDHGIKLGEVRYDGAANFLARFAWRPPAPVMEVSLIAAIGAIEVHWNVTTERPLDTLTILRAEPPASLQPVFTTAFAPGSGSFVDHVVVGGRTYQYQLVVTTPQGVEYRSSTVTATATVINYANTLAQNAPNPFNPTTSIAYTIAQRA